MMLMGSYAAMTEQWVALNRDVLRQWRHIRKKVQVLERVISMLGANDLLMHVKSIRQMARRAQIYGDTGDSQKLNEAADKLEEYLALNLTSVATVRSNADLTAVIIPSANDD